MRAPLQLLFEPQRQHTHAELANDSLNENGRSKKGEWLGGVFCKHFSTSSLWSVLAAMEPSQACKDSSGFFQKRVSRPWCWSHVLAFMCLRRCCLPLFWGVRTQGFDSQGSLGYRFWYKPGVVTTLCVIKGIICTRNGFFSDVRIQQTAGICVVWSRLTLRPIFSKSNGSGWEPAASVPVQRCDGTRRRSCWGGTGRGLAVQPLGVAPWTRRVGRVGVSSDRAVRLFRHIFISERVTQDYTRQCRHLCS